MFSKLDTQTIKRHVLTDLERHWFTFVPIFLGLGIVFYFQLNHEPDPYMAPIAASFMGLGVYTCLRSHKNLKALVFLYLCAISLGFSLAQLRTYLVSAPALSEEHGPAFVWGEIESIEDLEKGQRVIIRVEKIEDLLPNETPQKIRLRSYHAFGTHAGDQIKVLANLLSPSPPVIPGGFDFQRYAFFRQWGAVGYTLGKFEIQDQVSRVSPIKKVQSIIERNIENSLGEDKAAIPKALLIGNRSGINESDLQAIRDAGLAHMLAISGLHVGLFAGFIFFFVRAGLALIPPLALRFNIKKIAAFAGLLSAFIYMLIVGAPITTQRAFIMTGLVMLAIMLDRYPFSFRLAALAATIILVYRPESLMEVSFQLSFSAVIALIAFYDAYGKKLWHSFAGPSVTKKILFWLIGVTLTTLVASVATAPLTLYHFQHLAVYGNLGNILAVPVMTFWVMPMGVISLLVMPFGLDVYSFWAMNQGIQIILDISHWIADMDGAVWHMKLWSMPALLFSLLGGMLILFFARGLWPVGVLLFAIGFVLAAQNRMPDILVSEDAGTIGYFDGEQIYVSSGRKGAFLKENWERAYGFEGQEQRHYIDEAFACDNKACRKEVREHKISYTTRLNSLAEECLWANVLIANFPITDRQCSAKIIIDRFDVWRSGVHALTFKRNGIDIKTVEGERGARPWVTSNMR